MEGKRKYRRSIKLKITLIILITAVVISVLGVSAAYYLIRGLMREVIGYKLYVMAQLIGYSVTETIDAAVGKVEVLAETPAWKDYVSEQNLKYASIGEDSRQEIFKEMDRVWESAAPDDPRVKGYLDNDVSRALRQITVTAPEIKEIFITDRFGGLVSASQKTSDFYQADEKWWQGTYDYSRGSVFLEDISFDESSKVWSITVAVPIRDEAGNVLGICKAVVDVNNLFEPLTRFKVGRTGHAVLVDKNGYIVFHEGVEPLSVKFASDEDLRLSEIREGRGIILDSPHVHKEKMFVSFAVVKHPLLSKAGVKWRVFIDQEAEEVFSPLGWLFSYLLIFMGVLILLAVAESLILGNVIAAPIIKFRRDLKFISEGKLDYRLKINTGDEIEELADAFNQMMKNLRETMVSRDVLKEEVEERKIMQAELLKSQKQLKDKTEELDGSLKEAINSREILISMLSDNNEVREEMEKNLKELKQTQDMLIQSEKLASLGKLVSDMAHEVNNPLMVVSGRAQLILMEEMGNKKVQEYARIIVEQSQRAKDIIRRLLVFSKPSKGEIKKADINASLESVIQLVEHQFSLEDVRIVRNFTPSLPPVEMDEKQMQEVFMNLMKNSAEAISEGGTITVFTFREGKNIRVEFKDTGSGISGETLKKIFDPFFTTKEEGTGLGLSVCYGIVKAHGGELIFESSPGEGTTAIMLLPVEEE